MKAPTAEAEARSWFEKNEAACKGGLKCIHR